MPENLSECRIVLVRPQFPGNLGAAARLLRNFGLRQLVLVDPVADRWSMDAVMMAMGGRDLLQNAVESKTLAEAVADCHLVLATSGETGGLIRKGFWGTPEEKIPQLLDALDRGPAAIVFGPEPSGLTLAEIAACHGSIYIPTEADCPSLNLAQAIAICVYELRRQFLARSSRPVQGVDPPAPYRETEELFRHLHEALVAIRFLWDFRAEGIFHVIRSVLARAQLTRKEVQVFHGLAKQLLFVAREYGVPHPESDKTWRGSNRRSRHKPQPNQPPDSAL